MRQSEQALYITLIDFLIQIMFIGLVIGVVYVVVQTDDDQVKEEQQKQQEIAGKSGMKVAELTDYLTKLGPVTALGPAESVAGRVKLGSELEEAVAKVGGTEKAKEILEERSKGLKGQGYPSCLPDKKIIVTFHAYANSIKVKGSTPEFKAILSQLGIAPNKINNMSFNEFHENFAGVVTRYPSCRYNVNIVEYSDLKKPRDVIRKYFWARSIRNAK